MQLREDAGFDAGIFILGSLVNDMYSRYTRLDGNNPEAKWSNSTG